ncbi:MAG: hypothetical protein GY898_26890 [Proteobacteria bacterium]|nr:hypothetical protein [Pseudomonadota bacterium]
MLRAVAPLLLSVVLLGCPSIEPAPVEPPPAPLPSDQRGPYEVGAMTLRQVDDRGKFLIVEVWYPAVAGADDVQEPYADLGTDPRTFRDVPEDWRGAPYPLVAFSHGFAGIRYQSGYLTEYLASHGFVVIAVDHNHNTLLDLDEDVTATVAVERPTDVSKAVDTAHDLLPDGLVDPDGGFAMMGHSFGAWTTLVVSGGLLNRDELLAYCAETDARGCRFFTGPAVEALDSLEDAVPDPRARVAVSMAPGLAYSFGADGRGLADNVPTLVMGGSADSDMPYEDEIRGVYDALGPDGALLTLTDAGHFAFSDLCALGLPFEECAGAAEGWMEADRAHEVSRTVATAWVRARRLGESSEEVFLTEDSVGSGGDATWETH